MKQAVKMCVRNFIFLFLGQAFVLSSVQAQELIALSQEDISRLGIVFEELSLSDARNGVKVPALVINSPDAVSTISSLYSGFLVEWFVLPGDDVERGAVLAKINSEELLDIQNQWSAALTSKEQLGFELKKDQSLFGQGIISQQRFTSTQRSFEQSNFELKALEEKLSRAGLSSEQIQNIRAQDSELGMYFVRALESGRLTHRDIALGEYVNENSVLASLQTSSSLWVDAEVPSRLINSLQLGQNLSVEDEDQRLILRRVDSELDRRSQTLGIQAEFVEASRLLPGQLITLLIPPTADGVIIPSMAVIHSGDSTSIFVRTRNGVEVRTLSLISVGADYLAQSGVIANEEIVIQGTAVLKGILLGLGGE